jgi:hypothetical protein
VKFKGFNTKGEYVTNKCGQTGSMICILDGTLKKCKKCLEDCHEDNLIDGFCEDCLDNAAEQKGKEVIMNL